MFESFLNWLKPHKAVNRFEPVYSLAQLDALGHLPIVHVKPFVTLTVSRAAEAASPGVGGIVANLIRRNMLLTHQVSVIGVEDSGYGADRQAGELAADAEDQIPEYCDVLVSGRWTSENQAESHIELRINSRSQGHRTVQIRFANARVAEFVLRVTQKLAEVLKLNVTAAMQTMWQSGNLLDWTSLCLSADLWEKKDVATLVELMESGRTHADALAPLSGTGDLSLERRGFALTTAKDPVNAQLLFFHFCAIWKGDMRHQPEAAALLRQALSYSPGHGKSHMCLPHVTAMTRTNAPYILAHSELAYRLLRHNSFALNNFCRYLQSFCAGRSAHPRPLLGIDSTRPELSVGLPGRHRVSAFSQAAIRSAAIRQGPAPTLHPTA